MDKSATILIVDDYLLIRTSVRGVLAELGFFNVLQADNGKTAQDLMRKQPVDVVIGDWGMPVMNGLELLKWMRRDEKYRKVPFLMLTAEANPASVKSALIDAERSPGPRENEEAADRRDRRPLAGSSAGRCLDSGFDEAGADGA